MPPILPCNSMPRAGADLPSPQPLRRERWLLPLLLTAGAALFAAGPDERSRWTADLIGLAALLLACVPAINRSVTSWLDKLRSPSPRMRAIVAAVLFVMSSRYFLFSA